MTRARSGDKRTGVGTLHPVSGKPLSARHPETMTQFRGTVTVPDERTNQT